MESSEDSEFRKIQIEEQENLIELFGSNDGNIKLLESAFNVHIVIRNSHISIKGSPKDIRHAERIINESRKLTKQGFRISQTDIKQAISAIFEGKNRKLSELFKKTIYLPSKKKIIQPRSFMQKEYLKAIESVSAMNV